MDYYQILQDQLNITNLSDDEKDIFLSCISRMDAVELQQFYTAMLQNNIDLCTALLERGINTRSTDVQGLLRQLQLKKINVDEVIEYARCEDPDHLLQSL